MKVWRGPKQSWNPRRTDEKDLRKHTKRWEPGETIWFDGTIDKSGQRGTDFGVQLDARDVLALQAALGRHYQTSQKERAGLEKTVKDLEEALAKISRLVSYKRNQARDVEELLSAVQEIAEHFSDDWSRKKPFKSSFRWLRWKRI